ncbi:MAG: hypothetical protein R6V07_07860 [Armatimonadota bacterium]
MKTGTSSTAGWTLTCLVVLLLLVSVGVGQAADRLLFPQDIDLFRYCVGLGHTTDPPNEWVVTAFYYPVETIPPKYDLFDWPVYDYPVGEVTPLVEGAMTFMEGSSIPKIVEMWNAPGALVPIWFTPRAEWSKWTIKAMEKAGSLVGWADFYREVVRNPEEPGDPSVHETVASGVLEDGRSFKVWATHVNDLYSVRVELGD